MHSKINTHHSLIKCKKYYNIYIFKNQFHKIKPKNSMLKTKQYQYSKNLSACDPLKHTHISLRHP